MLPFLYDFMLSSGAELTSHGGQVRVISKVLFLLSTPFNLTMSSFKFLCFASILVIFTICSSTSASFFNNSSSNLPSLCLILGCSVCLSSVWAHNYLQYFNNTSPPLHPKSFRGNIVCPLDSNLEVIECILYLKRTSCTLAELSREQEAREGPARSLQLVHTRACTIILIILKSYSGLLNHTRACKNILSRVKSYSGPLNIWACKLTLGFVKS